jgi:hypothetical protein
MYFYIFLMINIFNMGSSNDDCLYKFWVHSYEEDDQADKVYRLSSFNFPPSFGRESLNIKEDGKITFSFPGPDEGIKHSDGQFKIYDQNKMHVDFKTKSTTITIVSCENDRLVIRQD